MTSKPSFATIAFAFSFLFLWGSLFTADSELYNKSRFNRKACFQKPSYFNSTNSVLAIKKKKHFNLKCSWISSDSTKTIEIPEQNEKHNEKETVCKTHFHFLHQRVLALTFQRQISIVKFNCSKENIFHSERLYKQQAIFTTLRFHHTRLKWCFCNNRKNHVCNFHHSSSSVR